MVSFPQTMPEPLCVPELLERILQYCDMATRLNFAAVWSGHHGLIRSFIKRQLHGLIRKYLDNEAIDGFWTMLNCTHAVISGSTVMNIVFPLLLSNNPSNLNIFIPIGESQPWMTFLSSHDYNVTHMQVNGQYRHTTVAAHMMINTIKVTHNNSF